MASDTNRNENIEALREAARAAEPYPDDHPYLRMFDAEFSPEIEARIWATIARNVLERNGYSWENDEDEQPDDEPEGAQ